LELHVHDVAAGGLLGWREPDRVVMQIVREPRIEMVLGLRAELLPLQLARALLGAPAGDESDPEFCAAVGRLRGRGR
jgi:hypothetical protein